MINNGESNISITPSGFFGNSTDNIQVREGLLSKEECKSLSDFVANNKIWDQQESHFNDKHNTINYWQDRVATYQSLIKTDPLMLDLIYKAKLILKEEIEKFFNVELYDVGPAICTWPTGTSQDPHADKEEYQGPDEGKPNIHPEYDIGSVFYINDNYDGGELYFTQHNKEFKPTAGSAYFFPGDKYYVHGIKEVKKGIRYTCPFFWKVKNHKGKVNEY